jgi:hypothetical protein
MNQNLFQSIYKIIKTLERPCANQESRGMNLKS